MDSSPSKLPGKPLFFYAYFKLLRSLNDPPWFHSVFPDSQDQFLLFSENAENGVDNRFGFIYGSFFPLFFEGELTMDSRLQIRISCNY